MTVTSRRDRLRAATLSEILETARRLLVADGLPAVTLRAISREMGMTAPALYRYYDSLDALLESLSIALFEECIGHVEAAVAEQKDVASKLGVACREFRRWSLAHRAEFALMFGRPSEQLPAPDDPMYAVGMRFCAVYLVLFDELWRAHPFAAPADDDLPADLRDQLATFKAATGTALTLGALQVYLSHWIRLYGSVALEVFGHLGFALTDAQSMFETELKTVMLSLMKPSTPGSGAPRS
ncbi:TetR/AcrR family transcriptional regulator [Virgisporangium aurantiacum]|uniref:TetR family transcriptional regulator n=1 Tax=Virgisporangium aurantiacum TaxID=175570 RepID=A0A8J3ZC13_9ACTN|nr:TetR/AcrR family transcriptional regulator [Virgisporangium aurantiacum]GIJ58881.1 TetR family transcriptional regulator [Virgisporangium aurantiacum]